MITQAEAVRPCNAGFQSWLVLLGALIAIGPLSIDMYLPGFPAMAREFSHLAGRPEYTLASFFVGMALGQLAYGPLSDRFGRKPPLYVGLILYVMASIAGALATDLISLAGWRFIQAVGGCAGMVITRAVVRDRCGVRDSARAFSMLMLVMGIAPILAPLLGGWVVAGLGWRAIFWVLAGFGIFCLIVVRLGMTETHDTRHAAPLNWRTVGCDYHALLSDRFFMGYALSSGLAMSTLFAFISGSPHVLIDLYGLTSRDYGFAFGSNAAGFIVASQVNARLLRSMQPTKILRRALRLTALTALILLGVGMYGQLSFTILMALLIITTASLGFIVPNATAAALATHGQLAGTASALMGALQFGLATLVGTVMGLSQGDSTAPLVSIMAVCALGAWFSSRLHRQYPSERKA